MIPPNESGEPERTTFLRLPLPRVLVASLLLFAAAIAVHSGSLGGQFLSWDDELYLTGNARIQSPGWENLAWFFRNPYFSSYTPLAFVSHALDWKLWGADPRGHHAHSLLLHGLNTVALFWLGLFLFGRRFPLNRTGGASAPVPAVSRDALIVAGTTTALLFAVHPLKVESVAWISDRKDLLAAFFGLSATLAYFRGTCGNHASPSWLWLSLSVLLFSLALLSKFLIVFLPLAFLVVEFLLLYPTAWHDRKRQLVLWKSPYAIPALVIGLLAMNAIGADTTGLRTEQIQLAHRLIYPVATPWFYLEKLFVPANLSPVYQIGVTPTTWLITVPIMAITVLGVGLWRRGRPAVLTAWLVYLLLLSPTFLFLSPFIQHTADRHSYFSTIPLFLLAGGGVGILWIRSIGQNTGTIIRATLVSLVLILCCWYSYLAIRQTRVWQDSVSLWAQAITVSPDLPIGFLNLGNAVAATGNADDAIPFYRRAIALETAYGPAWTNLAVVYQLQGKIDEAEECLRRSIAGNPEYFEAYLNLGEIEEGKNNLREAEKLYRQASVQNPGSPKPWVHLGELFRPRQEDSAFSAFRRALALDPFSAPAHYGIAMILEGRGETAMAARHLEEAARLGHRGAKNRLQGR